MKTLAVLFGIAVVTNYLWELTQAPLYVGLESYDAAIFWHCFIASLGDGLMVLLIVAAGWLMLGQLDWFEHPGVSGYVIILAVGLVLGVLVEWLGVHVLGRWQYTEKMPIVPLLKIGLVPIAQMLFLPPLIFRIAAALKGANTK